MNLWINWEELGPNLSLTIENKASNLHKNKGCYYFKHIEWGTPLPRIYQWIGGNMFSTEKNEILNPSWVGKTLNKNVDYYMYYPSRQYVKWKHYNYKFTLHSKQWFHEEQKAKFI